MPRCRKIWASSMEISSPQWKFPSQRLKTPFLFWLHACLRTSIIKCSQIKWCSSVFRYTDRDKVIHLVAVHEVEGSIPKDEPGQWAVFPHTCLPPGSRKYNLSFGMSWAIPDLSTFGSRCEGSGIYSFSIQEGREGMSVSNALNL